MAAKNSRNLQKNVKLPIEIWSFYDWLYGAQKHSLFFDKNWVCDVLTLGATHFLAYEVIRDIPMNAKTIQFGATFGPQIDITANKITPYGKFVIIDKNPLQILRCEQKYENLYPQLSFIKADVTRFKSEEKFDRVICYNLLHELPPLSKIRAVDNALNLLTPHGKAIFIEYSNPSKWNPLRYFIRMFNRLFQPFAEKLWERSIDMYASQPQLYNWRKTTYWGGMYQKVVVTRKPPLR